MKHLTKFNDDKIINYDQEINNEGHDSCITQKTETFRKEVFFAPTKRQPCRKMGIKKHMFQGSDSPGLDPAGWTQIDIMQAILFHSLRLLVSLWYMSTYQIFPIRIFQICLQKNGNTTLVSNG